MVRESQTESKLLNLVDCYAATSNLHHAKSWTVYFFGHHLVGWDGSEPPKLWIKDLLLILHPQDAFILLHHSFNFLAACFEWQLQLSWRRRILRIGFRNASKFVNFEMFGTIFIRESGLMGSFFRLLWHVVTCCDMLWLWVDRVLTVESCFIVCQRIAS